MQSLDEVILMVLANCPQADDARLNSETAGSMIDRLSILSLKIHHMREQTFRMDAGDEHVRKCRDKLHRLMEQRRNLSACLQRLLDETSACTAYLRFTASSRCTTIRRLIRICTQGKRQRVGRLHRDGAS